MTAGTELLKGVTDWQLGAWQRQSRIGQKQRFEAFPQTTAFVDSGRLDSTSHVSRHKPLCDAQHGNCGASPGPPPSTQASFCVRKLKAVSSCARCS